MKARVLSLILVFCSSVYSYANDLTLQQAVHEAVKDSPKVQKAQSMVEAAGWRRVETYSGFLPSLNASGTYLTDKQYLLTDIKFPGSPVTTSIPQIIPTSSVLLSAQISLFDGLSSTRRWQAAGNFEAAAEKDFAWTRFQTELDVVLNFYRALAAQNLKEVSEQNLKTLDDHLRDVSLFKSVGVSTNYDVLRVEVQVSEGKSEVMNAADNSVLARLKLNEILGKEEDPRLLTGSLPILDLSVVKTLALPDLRERADVMALADRVEAFDHLESAAGSYLIPRLSAFFNYQYYNNITDDPYDKNSFRHAHSAGLTLTWNIFDGLISQAKSKESIEEKYQAEKTLQITKLKAKQDFEFWKRKYVYFCSIYQSRASEVSKSTESVRLAKAGRRAGTRTSTDLLDSELELFRARAGMINAQMGAIEALVQLELASGKKII